MEIKSLPRHSLVEDVSSQLTEAIRHDLASAEGYLPAERKLAEQFGVSRPVIREAMQRLEFQGLVEVRQGRGCRVVNRLHTPVSASLKLLLPEEKERLLQSLEVRLTLEPRIAERAAERVKRKDAAALKRAHEALENASGLEAAMEADLSFHHELARISGNQVFGLMLDSISELGRESRRATISRAGVETAIKHHAAILQKVTEGNPKAAAAAMLHHIKEASRDLLKPAKTA